MATLASRSTTYAVSTSLPSTRPATAALASPGPMDAATSATLTGASKARFDPSGNCTEIIYFSQQKKSAVEPHFFTKGRTRPGGQLPVNVVRKNIVDPFVAVW